MTSEDGRFGREQVTCSLVQIKELATRSNFSKVTIVN